MLAGVTVAVQAGLDFIGIDNPQTPTWGNILSDGFSHIYQRSILLLWPSLAVGVTSLAFVLFGNSLRDRLARGMRRTRPSRPPSAKDIPPTSTIIVSEHATGPFADAPVLLSVDELAIGYDRPDGSLARVVEDVSLKVHVGEVHGLVGESGSGKTQTAWAALDLLPPGGRVLFGTVQFDGQDLTSRGGSRAWKGLRGGRIGYVPQEPMSNLDPSFTVGAQITEPLRAHLGLSRAEARSRATELLAEVGIAEPERTFAAYPHEISGGMAQRVLIAGAISCRPDLLIADEPTTALDVTIQADILDLMRTLTQKLGLSILLVTHNFGVVADLCDTVSVMQHGRIVERGPVRSVFSQPRHPYTQSLFDFVLDDTEPEGMSPAVPTAQARR